MLLLATPNERVYSVVSKPPPDPVIFVEFSEIIMIFHCYNVLIEAKHIVHFMKVERKCSPHSSYMYMYLVKILMNVLGSQ